MDKSKWVIVQKYLLIFLFSAVTEVWDYESGENEIIEPTLPDISYMHGIALFAVDAYFCNIWIMLCFRK